MTFNAHAPPTHVALIFVKPALWVGWEGTVISHSQLLIQPLRNVPLLAKWGFVYRSFELDITVYCSKRNQLKESI